MLFFFYWSGDHRDLHSFPTRRSSDLKAHERLVARLVVTPERVDRMVAELGLVFESPEFKARLRSEEHTSELQSRRDLVCRLLLEKKKKKLLQRDMSRHPASFLLLSLD